MGKTEFGKEMCRCCYCLEIAPGILLVHHCYLQSVINNPSINNCVHPVPLVDVGAVN